MNELMGNLSNLGTTMEHVAIMMSQHNEVQMGSLISALNEYSSLVKAIPTVAHGVKWREEPSAGGADPMVISNVVLSEFRHFHETLGKDLKLIVETFIQQQVAYHRQVSPMSTAAFRSRMSRVHVVFSFVCLTNWLVIRLRGLNCKSKMPMSGCFLLIGFPLTFLALYDPYPSRLHRRGKVCYPPSPIKLGDPFT